MNTNPVNTTPVTLPTYFISHGGGPWPWMKDLLNGTYDKLEIALQAMPAQIGARPHAVLVISGHWEAREFTVMSSPQPPMLYDYSGFPPHTYAIRYPAPGAPQIAARVQQLLAAAGFAAPLDALRGYDHGTFTPLSVIYPSAQVPVLQLSLRHGYDPREHIAVGQALAPLRNEGVLIVGSGLSYHNLREFGPAARAPSAAFDRWLQETLVDADPAARIQGLIDWETAPAAATPSTRLAVETMPSLAPRTAARSQPMRLLWWCSVCGRAARRTSLAFSPLLV